MQTITLRGKAELDIYINPRRQHILREMALHGRPMTPKQLAQKVGISASAAQHHIAKLVSLGVVAPDHTERVRGITAQYYRLLPVTVRVGYGSDAQDAPARLALIQNGVNEVLGGFAAHVRQSPPPPLEAAVSGDVLWGVARLTEAEAQALFATIRDFLAEHDAAAREGDAWAYALIAYPAGGQGDA
jgi:DNA-binding transcriptional ArsR family regulator